MTINFKDVTQRIDWCLSKYLQSGKDIKPHINPNSKINVLVECKAIIIRLREQVAADVAVINHLQTERDAFKAELDKLRGK